MTARAIDLQRLSDVLSEWNESGRPIVVARSSRVSFHPLFAALLEAQRAVRRSSSGATVDSKTAELLRRTGRG
jgi:hypothetical protein